MERTLICPGCESRMQPHFVKRKGAEVELSRCQFCGGVFGDRAQLAAAAKVLEQPVDLPGHSARRCASCRTTMESMVLRNVPVEYCSSCTGIYLDDGELKRLAESAPEAQRTEQDVELACAHCQKRVPFAESFPSGEGRVCRECSQHPELRVGVPDPKAGAPDTRPSNGLVQLVNFLFSP